MDRGDFILGSPIQNVTLSRARVYAMSLLIEHFANIFKNLHNILLLSIFSPEQFEQRIDYRWAAYGKTLH